MWKVALLAVVLAACSDSSSPVAWDGMQPLLICDTTHHQQVQVQILQGAVAGHTTYQIGQAPTPTC